MTKYVQVAADAANGTPFFEAVASRSKLWPSIVSHVFFCFFTSPILSPAINERTFYLNWIVPLLDPDFLKFMHRFASRVPAQAVFATSALMAWLVVTAPDMALRWLLILWPLAYLKYSFDEKIFHLYTWIGINIGVALAQALAYFYGGSSLAFLIGPNNISSMIWGSYATRALTNFYSIVPGVDFPRFCGLSREGGFFAALLATVVLLKKVTLRPIGLVLLLGIGLSLSKSTMFLVIGWVVAVIAMRDRRSPAVLFLVVFCALILLYYVFIDAKFMAGELSGTFTHRLYPYAALLHDLDAVNILVGIRASAATLVQFSAFHVCSSLAGYVNCLETPSFVGLIVSTGFVGLLLFLYQLYVLGLTVWGVLLVVILTSNVGPLTDTSFVVLSYFVAMQVGVLPNELIKRARHTNHLYGVQS